LQALSAPSQGLLVPFKGDDPAVRCGLFEDGGSVATQPQGTVDINAAGDRPKILQTFIEENRTV
jgi:hypothetical protein